MTQRKKTTRPGLTPSVNLGRMADMVTFSVVYNVYFYWYRSSGGAKGC